MPRPRALACAGLGAVELLLFDRNATITDADRDAGRLLPFLIELVAENHGNDGKRADQTIGDIPIHDDGPVCRLNELENPERHSTAPVRHAMRVVGALSANRSGDSRCC